MRETRMKNGGIIIRRFIFQVNGQTRTIWARNQREATKRAEKLWAGPYSPIPIN